MKEEKNVWYKTDGVIIGLIIFILFLVYGFAYIVFIKNSDDKTLPAFTVITGLAGIVVSIGTVYYVIKTYNTQKKQIALQKEEIEYNRAIDMIYKQLVYTNKRFKPVGNSFYLMCYEEIIDLVRRDKTNILDDSMIITWLVDFIKCIRFFNDEFILYQAIIKPLNKDIQKKLINVITWNISPHLLESLIEFNGIVNVTHSKLIDQKFKGYEKTNVRINIYFLEEELKKCVSFLRSEFDDDDEIN